MAGVAAIDILAGILTIHDAEIRFGGIGARVCLTFAIYTNLTARARCTFLRSVRFTGSIASCIAVGVIRFGIDAENRICSDACADIYIAAGTSILAIAAGTLAGCGIRNRVI